MKENTHRFIAIKYELNSVENGAEHFIEKTEEQKPMQFYTGYDMALPAFEEEIVKHETGANFEFSLTKEQAYGEHDANSVLALDKETFSVNGEFDAKNIYKDAIVPLQNEQGQRFLGKVLEVSDDKVTIDLNHPLAGKDLRFRGQVIENREASEAEVKDFLDRMNQHHCGCGGGCEGNCSDGDSCSCGGECGDGCNCGN